MRRVPELMTDRARAFRREATPAERALWRVLSPTRPRWTRQLVVGPFIVDLACRSAWVAVELDGGQHAERTNADAVRTAWLNRQGWRVVRLWNNEVLADLVAAAEFVLAIMTERLDERE